MVPADLVSGVELAWYDTSLPSKTEKLGLVMQAYSPSIERLRQED